MGDRNRSFTFTVLSSEAMGAGSGYTLSEGGQTATFTLSHEQAVTLKDVPVGAVLTLSEQGAEGYERTITVNGETADDTITVRDGENNVLVTNEKNASPDTGILLDSLPYVLILALILGIGVIAFIRKRAEQDED